MNALQGLGTCPGGCFRACDFLSGLPGCAPGSGSAELTADGKGELYPDDGVDGKEFDSEPDIEGQLKQNDGGRRKEGPSERLRKGPM